MSEIDPIHRLQLDFLRAHSMSEKTARIERRQIRRAFGNEMIGSVVSHGDAIGGLHVRCRSIEQSLAVETGLRQQLEQRLTDLVMALREERAKQPEAWYRRAWQRLRRV